MIDIDGIPLRSDSPNQPRLTVSLHGMAGCGAHTCGGPLTKIGGHIPAHRGKETAVLVNATHRVGDPSSNYLAAVHIFSRSIHPLFLEQSQMATSLSATSITGPEPTTVNINNVTAQDPTTANDPYIFSHGLTGVYQPMNYLFVNILITTVLSFTILAICLRVVTAIVRDRRRVSTITSAEGHNFWSNNRTTWWPWTKRHWLYSPIWRKRHNHEFQLTKAVSVGTLPTRLQLIIISIYFCSNVAYTLAIPEQKKDQRVAEFRGRAGALAVFNLIFVILFALRNNPFIWLLHISYDTFNLFHRWIARIVFLEALAHIFAWMFNTYRVDYQGRSGWESINWVLGQSLSYRWGLAAFIAFAFLMFHSISVLRHAFYESFLTLHRLSIIVALSGVYFHMAKHALPQLPWGYLFISLLAAEPVIRMIRIFYYNSSFRRRTWTKVTVEALPGEASKVTFELSRAWSANPGAFVHVYLPRVSLWGSHPFSVAWYADTAQRPSLPTLPSYESQVSNSTSLSASSSTTKVNIDRLPKFDFEDAPNIKVLTKAPPQPKSIKDLEIRRGPSSISCILRARTGMTRSLYTKASQSATGCIDMWGAIEGPYGGYHSLDSYGTVVLFAAGVGITHCISFVRYLLAGHNARSTATQKVLLVWSIQSTDMLQWIQPWLDEIMAMPDYRSVVRVRLYVSQRKMHGEALPYGLDVRHGRCDPQEVVDGEVLEQIGAMVVTVCGPGAYSDSVRAAVRRRVGLKSVDFIEEAFSY
ncbi:hypothetical protein EJ04DRAFT_551085 [Polyplosphaeria fusca]|uniref:FAD-binding FR-type domain-containing protein n=1 Tax=Polyplosphaeria fusca TaxID=682080 RepID=A0A9P4V4T4_9PLEO|nr:hypothetical protein EJ04DRAFT_551085 [Polyplosphaeria fusca]